MSSPTGGVSSPAIPVRRRVAARPWPALVPLACALILLALVMVVALLVGPARIPAGVIARVIAARALHLRAGEWSAGAEQIVWNIRLPRVLLAALVGGTLALAGTAYQGVFRNPLADPYLIGVAAGAGLGATLVFVSPVASTWHGVSAVTPAAFLGATVATVLAYSVARGSGDRGGAGLILAGVAVAALCNAATTFLTFYDNQKAASVFAWLLGGFNASSWSRVWLVAPYALLAAVVVGAHARVLNVLLLDEEQARQLGIDVERVKLYVLGAASLAAAAAVSVSGLIGFVGLLVPHVARMLVGADHRRVLPLALAGGAALLVGADVVARTALAPVEIPVGVITALLGGPFFLYLLIRRGRTA